MSLSRSVPAALLVALALIFANCGSSAHPKRASAFLFDDEFTGTALNLNKWQPNWLGPNDDAITKPINGSEQSCYAPEQVSQAGGHLILVAVAGSCTVGGKTYPYRSGLVESRTHFTFTFGRIEARVWTQGKGTITNWPAFWADGTGTWPVTGENDVFEGLSGRACYHFHSTSGGPGGCATSSSGWHTYGSTWAPGSVTYTYDGVAVGRITAGITSAPMYLIANLGVGGAGGRVQIPGRMGVDWIRVTAK